MRKKIRLIYNVAKDPHSLHRSIRIGLVVGTILNIINQGDAIFGFTVEPINFTKFVFTYFVPFFVSLYTSVVIKLKLNVGSHAPIDALIECEGCGARFEVKEGETIPCCNNCQANTMWHIKE